MYQFAKLSRRWLVVILFAAVPQSSLVFAAENGVADPPPAFAWAKEPGHSRTSPLPMSREHL